MDFLFYTVCFCVAFLLFVASLCDEQRCSNVPNTEFVRYAWVVLIGSSGIWAAGEDRAGRRRALSINVLDTDYHFHIRRRRAAGEWACPGVTSRIEIASRDATTRECQPYDGMFTSL